MISVQITLPYSASHLCRLLSRRGFERILKSVPVIEIYLDAVVASTGLVSIMRRGSLEVEPNPGNDRTLTVRGENVDEITALLEEFRIPGEHKFQEHLESLLNRLGVLTA